MRIKRHIHNDGNLYTKAFNILDSLPDNVLVHEQHKMRHPRVILYRSFAKVLSLMEDLLFEIQNLQNMNYDVFEVYIRDTDKIGAQIKRISSIYENLILAISSYIEDANNILKSLTPITSPITERFVHRWLKKARHPTFALLYSQIKDYRNEVAHYANIIKHEHGIINIVFGIYDSTIIMGFNMRLVEVIDGSEALEVEDFNNIKSFNFELQYHFYQFYRIGEILFECIFEALKHYYGEDFNFNYKAIKSNSQENNRILNFCSKLKKLHSYTFPNKDLLTPKVLLTIDGDGFCLEYPIGIVDDKSRIVAEMKMDKTGETKETLLILFKEGFALKFQNLAEGEKLSSKFSDENFEKMLIYVSKGTWKNPNNKFDLVRITYEFSGITVESNINMNLIIFVRGGESPERIHLKNFVSPEYQGITLNVEREFP